MELFPLLEYLKKVLDEHTLPLEGSSAVLIEARWLLDLLHKVEASYKKNGLL